MEVAARAARGVVRLHVKEGYIFTPLKRVTSSTWGPSLPYKQALRMDKTNINALGQSIERYLHLIDKNLFSIKQYQSPPPPQKKLEWT